MSVRPFVMYPDRRLKTPAAPVGRVTGEVRAVWDDMVDTMEAMPGLGLAAPQIGVGLRLAVVDASETRGQAVRMADPELLWVSDETGCHPEASPNLPGVEAEVERPVSVRVAFIGADGTRVERDFNGLWARSVLHQIDHLEGRMYVDRLSRTKRDMLLRKARKRTAAPGGILS